MLLTVNGYLSGEISRAAVDRHQQDLASLHADLNASLSGLARVDGTERREPGIGIRGKLVQRALSLGLGCRWGKPVL